MKLPEAIASEVAKYSYFKTIPVFRQKKTQEITTIALTLVTLSLFGLFAINPTLSTIAQLKRELSDNQEVDAKLKQKITNLGLLQQQYAAIQGDIPTVLSAIPQNPQPSTLTAQLQTIASATNVTLVRVQTFQVDITEKKNNTSTLSYMYSLTTQGNSQNIHAFLRELSNFERIITVDNLTITTSSEGSGIVELNIRGKSYYKK